MSAGIRKLEEAMQELEQEIAVETENLKSAFARVAESMPEDMSYYLIGIHTGSVVKAYHLTSKGVGVQGEGFVTAAEFIDSAMRFANFPKRKIEVLADLAGHLQKIEAKIGCQQTT
jgi:hypothetical protein